MRRTTRRAARAARAASGGERVADGEYVTAEDETLRGVAARLGLDTKEGPRAIVQLNAARWPGLRVTSKFKAGTTLRVLAAADASPALQLGWSGGNGGGGGEAASTVGHVQDDVWEAEKIVESRVGRGGGVEYCVKWVGWAEQHNTWEPAANLLSPLLVASFEGQRKHAVGVRRLALTSPTPRRRRRPPAPSAAPVVSPLTAAGRRRRGASWYPVAGWLRWQGLRLRVRDAAGADVGSRVGVPWAELPLRRGAAAALREGGAAAAGGGGSPARVLAWED